MAIMKVKVMFLSNWNKAALRLSE